MPGAVFKAVAIPHFSVMANVMQLAIHTKLNDNRVAWDDQRFRSGDTAIGGSWF